MRARRIGCPAVSRRDAPAARLRPGRRGRRGGRGKPPDPGVVKHVGPCGLPGAEDPPGSSGPVRVAPARPAISVRSGPALRSASRRAIRALRASGSSGRGAALSWSCQGPTVVWGGRASGERSGPKPMTAPAPDPASRAFELRRSKPQAPIPAPPSQRLATAPPGGRERPHQQHSLGQQSRTKCEHRRTRTALWTASPTLTPHPEERSHGCVAKEDPVRAGDALVLRDGCCAPPQHEGCGGASTERRPWLRDA